MWPSDPRQSIVGWVKPGFAGADPPGGLGAMPTAWRGHVLVSRTMPTPSRGHGTRALASARPSLALRAAEAHGLIRRRHLWLARRAAGGLRLAAEPAAHRTAQPWHRQHPPEGPQPRRGGRSLHAASPNNPVRPLSRGAVRGVGPAPRSRAVDLRLGPQRQLFGRGRRPPGRTLSRGRLARARRSRGAQPQLR